MKLRVTFLALGQTDSHQNRYFEIKQQCELNFMTNWPWVGKFRRQLPSSNGSLISRAITAYYLSIAFRLVGTLPLLFSIHVLLINLRNTMLEMTTLSGHFTCANWCLVYTSSTPSHLPLSLKSLLFHKVCLILFCGSWAPKHQGAVHTFFPNRPTSPLPLYSISVRSLPLFRFIEMK